MDSTPTEETGIIIFDGESKHLQLYNQRTNKFHQMKSLHKELTKYSAALLADDIYVISEKKAVHRLKYLDEDAQWERLYDTIEDHGEYPPVAVMEGQIYIAGGGEAAKKTEKYNPRSGDWELIPGDKTMETHYNILVSCPAPKETSDHVKSHLYSIGGKSPTGYVRLDAERFDPETQTWELIPPMMEQRWNGAAVQYNGAILVFGGYDDRNEAIPVAEKYDPSTNAWTEIKKMLSPRAIFDAFLIDEELYIFDKETSKGHGERYNVRTGERKELTMPGNFTTLTAIRCSLR